MSFNTGDTIREEEVLFRRIVGGDAPNSPVYTEKVTVSVKEVACQPTNLVYVNGNMVREDYPTVIDLLRKGELPTEEDCTTAMERVKAIYFTNKQ